MENEKDILPPHSVEPADPKRARTPDQIAGEKRRALERTAKWREQDGSVWPPMPRGYSAPRPGKRRGQFSEFYNSERVVRIRTFCANVATLLSIVLLCAGLVLFVVTWMEAARKGVIPQSLGGTYPYHDEWHEGPAGTISLLDLIEYSDMSLFAAGCTALLAIVLRGSWSRFALWLLCTVLFNTSFFVHATLTD